MYRYYLNTLSTGWTLALNAKKVWFSLSSGEQKGI